MAAQAFDYMHADAMVIFGLFAAVVRSFRLTRPALWLGPGLAAAGALAYHARYMLAVRFDYDYNMKLCIALAVGQSLWWIVWAMVTRHPVRGGGGGGALRAQRIPEVG